MLGNALKYRMFIYARIYKHFGQMSID